MSRFDYTVGHNLRVLRKARRWTLEETADALGAALGRTLTVGGYSRWETERSSWTTSELLAMCTMYEVPLARLMLPDIDDPWDEHDAIKVWNVMYALNSHVRPWWPLQR